VSDWLHIEEGERIVCKGGKEINQIIKNEKTNRNEVYVWKNVYDLKTKARTGIL